MSSMPPPPPRPGGGDQDPSSGGAEPGGPAEPAHGGHASPPPQGSPPGAQPDAFQGGPAAPQRNSMAVTALVLGLIAFPGMFVIGVVPLVNVLTILTPLVAIAAIVLGIVGIRRARRPAVRGGVGMSVAGMVLGAINLLFVAVLVVSAVLFFRACPIDFAGPPEQAAEEAFECMVEQGWLEPGDRDMLEEQLEQELEGR